MPSDMELEAAAGQYLNGIKANPGIDASVIEKMEGLFHQKLWHQLTTVIVSSIEGGMLAGDTLVMFYECVVKAIEGKCNPLQVVWVAVETSKSQTDHDTALQFLRGVLDRIQNRRNEKVTDTEAGIFVKMRIAWHHLEMGDLDQCKCVIDECQTLLEVLLEVDNRISAAFYETKAHYYKLKGASGEYYKAALRYLTFSPIETIGDVQKVGLARDLCLAALVTDDIFTFGEILMHPVLEALNGTDNEWMVKMIRALNYGHIKEFDALWSSDAAAINAHPIVVNSKQLLKQKVSIAALLELIFHRKADERLIAFADVAVGAVIELNEVELLLMKAMSLGLIKGRIDEVDQTVSVTWAVPHALDLEQIAVVKGNIEEWAGKTLSTMKIVEDQTTELLE
jgi:26S proteasome regulatory subunit N9